MSELSVWVSEYPTIHMKDLELVYTCVVAQVLHDDVVYFMKMSYTSSHL